MIKLRTVHLAEDFKKIVNSQAATNFGGKFPAHENSSDNPRLRQSQEFITTKSTSIHEIFEDSSPSVPILIVLTQGVDPTDMIDKFAAEQ